MKAPCAVLMYHALAGKVYIGIEILLAMTDVRLRMSIQIMRQSPNGKRKPPLLRSVREERSTVSDFSSFFEAGVSESHQTVKTAGCISKMTPLAG